MAVKLNVQYGHWTNDEGRQLSIQTPGLIVFNGAKQEVYVDGKIFGTSAASFQSVINRVQTLEEFREAMTVAEYAQAEWNDGATALTIFGISQGTEGTDNDGKIAKGATQSLVINLDGSYDEETNKIATQTTVDTAVKGLRAEILGTLNPEELEKTIDTIKEIQETLIGGSYSITDSEGNVIPTSKVVLTEETTIDETIYPAGTTLWTDGTTPVEDAVIYAKQEVDSEEVEYEEGYSNLTQNPDLNGLLNKIEANEQAIADINNASLVNVEENVENSFVTSSKSEDETPVYTIGVNYGSFKTGHGNVMDPESQAFTNGIATVEDVQRYIEERMTWVSYVSDMDSVVAEMTETPGETYSFKSDIQPNQSLTIK